MLLTEYDAKFHEKCLRKEEYDDGFAEGLSQGISQGISQGLSRGHDDERITIVINALNSGMTESEITTKLLIPAESIEAAKKEMLSAK